MLLRVIFIGPLTTDVVLFIQVLSVLLSMVLSLLAVKEVKALGLSQLVNLSSGEADEELFGKSVANSLSCESVSGENLRNVQSVRQYTPSLRWWSSKSFMAPKEAAPARASWPKLDLCSSKLLLLTWS